MNINQLIKGIIVGIAKVIPGLSGAVLMISFNLYDRALDAITHFFDNFKKNFLFLFNLGMGVSLGIVLFSKVIYYFITNYYLYTMALFLGLIIGGVPTIFKGVSKKGSSIFIVFVSFFVMFGLTFLGTGEDYVLKNTYVDLLVFFVAGFLEAVGMILPGISSTALLMILGVYDYYLIIIGGIFNINSLMVTLRFVLPFIAGMLFGIVGISLLINYLFKWYREETFSLIFGVSVASIFMIVKNLIPFINNGFQVFLMVVLLSVGYLITNKLE